MPNDRDIGDLVARFRLIVDEHGTKKATAELDNLEKKLGRTGNAVGNVSGKFSNMHPAVAAATTGLLFMGAAVTALTQAFLEAGRSGELAGEDQERFIELDNSLANLTDTVREGALALASELAPALSELADLAADLIPLGVTLVETMLKPLVWVADAVDSLTGSEEDEMDASRELTRQIERQTKARKEQEEALQKAEAAFREQVDAQIDAIEAQLQVESAYLNLESAQRDLLEAQEDIHSASERTAEDALKEAAALEEIRDAQHALNEARFRAVRAADDLAEAQNAVVETEFRFGVQSMEADEARDDLRDAQHELEEANYDVGESTEDVAAKQLEYLDVLDDVGPESDKAKDASERLARAQLAVKEAALAVLSAETRAAEAIAIAGGHTHTAADYTQTYIDKLTSLSTLVKNDPVLTALLLGATTTLDRMMNPAATDPNIGPLFNTDFATGAALSSQGAASQPAVIIEQQTITALDPAAAGRDFNAEIDWAARSARAGG